MIRSFVLLATICVISASVQAQVDARMLQYPDVSQTHIVFSYAGDLWVVPKEGGTMTVDPKAEWKQIFTDVWRFERDFFYDPNMHGVDWNQMKVRYEKLLDNCVTRWDVNFVIGDLIAELSSSHTYRGGGDVDDGPVSNFGYLGVDWELSGGAYRIKDIVADAP